MLVRKLSLPMQLSHHDVGYVIILCKVIRILIIINKHEPHMRLFWLPDTTFISHVSRYSWLRHKIWAIKIVLNFELRLFFFSFHLPVFVLEYFHCEMNISYSYLLILQHFGSSPSPPFPVHRNIFNTRCFMNCFLATSADF